MMAGLLHPVVRIPSSTLLIASAATKSTFCVAYKQASRPLLSPRMTKPLALLAAVIQSHA
jgi:hypothetical protein